MRAVDAAVATAQPARVTVRSRRTGRKVTVVLRPGSSDQLRPETAIGIPNWVPSEAAPELGCHAGKRACRARTRGHVGVCAHRVEASGGSAKCSALPGGPACLLPLLSSALQRSPSPPRAALLPPPQQALCLAAWMPAATCLRARPPPPPAAPLPSWPPASGLWRWRARRRPLPSSARQPARPPRRPVHRARPAAPSCHGAAPPCRPSLPSRCPTSLLAWRWAPWWGRAPLGACTAGSGADTWWPSRSSTAPTPPRQGPPRHRAPPTRQLPRLSQGAPAGAP